MNKNIALCTLGLFVGVTAVFAEVLEDFEPGTTYSGAGAIEADPLDAGNSVLRLTGGEVATFIPSDFEGVVTMRVYDFGGIPVTTHGPRWGVSAGTNSVAIAIIHKNPWLISTAGYGVGQEPSRTGDWWSPAFFGGPRQDGKWTTWTFDVDAEGGVTIFTSFGSKVYGPGSVVSMEEIWISGGKGGETQDVLIDDITFTTDAFDNPLIFMDSDLATLEVIGGGDITLTDIAGDPGMQVDTAIFFTNSVVWDGTHIGVPLDGGDTTYDNQPWKIDVVNLGPSPVQLQQKFALANGDWTNEGAASVWMNVGTTNAFSVIVPEGGISLAMFMILANSDRSDTNPDVDGRLPVSLQIIGPTPAVKTPMELYLNWAADYGLTNITGTAAMDYDVEPDGMDNLLEYALGGNPTNDDAIIIQPVDTFIDGDTWEYVYKRYRDATGHGLTYDLQTADVLGSWASSGGMYETGTNSTDAAFDVVTNTVTGLNAEMFINLEVTESF